MSAEARRHGGRTVRPLRRRRRVGHVLCQLHRLQRIPHQPAAAGDQTISGRSRPRRWWAAPRPTRAWRCFRAGFAGASRPCPDRTANRIRLRTPIIRSSGRTRFACQRPARAWEALQLGNCGPPIETEAGWLVLTHGVGPMRTYRIGAILLDLEDPTRIVGQLRRAAAEPRRRRAGRLRPQCRLLVRRACAWGNIGAAVRHQRRRHRCRDGAAG